MVVLVLVIGVGEEFDEIVVKEIVVEVFCFGFEFGEFVGLLGSECVEFVGVGVGIGFFEFIEMLE